MRIIEDVLGRLSADKRDGKINVRQYIGFSFTLHVVPGTVPWPH